MWRIIFLITVSYLYSSKFSNNTQEIKENCIVRTKLYGDIFYDDDVLSKIEYLKNNDNIKGVLVEVNSGGGEITASEALYRAFYELKEKKPVIASIKSVGASGAYMAIMSANKIFAYETSAIGSIGVMMEGFVDFSSLAEKIGIKFYNYKSSPLKAIPNNFEKPTEEGNASMQKFVNQQKEIFKNMLINSRLNVKDIEQATNGEIFTGNKALELHLIDAIGTERDALNDLKNNHNLKTYLTVIDYDIINFQENSNGFMSHVKSFLITLQHYKLYTY